MYAVMAKDSVYSIAVISFWQKDDFELLSKVLVPVPYWTFLAEFVY